jgi:hypothetical protein
MLQHRFREQLGLLTSAPAAVAADAGFLACPCLASPGLMMASPAYIAAVYEAAREMTAAQLRPVRRPIPAFSRN